MNFKLAFVGLAVVSLAACGGGGGGDSTPPPVVTPPVVTPPVVTPPVTPATKYTPVPAKSGDTYTYSSVDTGSDGKSKNIVITEQVASINPANGNYVKNRFDEDKRIIGINVLNPSNGQLSENACTFSPALSEVVYPAFVGQSLSQTATETCVLQDLISKQIINFNVSGKVLSYENITVPAGSFNTLKVQNKFVISNGAGTAQALDPLTQDRTCWVDIVSGFNVKCDIVNTFSPAVSYVNLAKSSYQLTSVTNASKAAFILNGSIAGTPSPYLYAFPDYSTVLSLRVGQSFELDTTRAVAWSVITGGNTVNLSGGSTNIVYKGISLTITTTGTSLIVSSSYPGVLSDEVSLTFKAALLSDKAKIVTVNTIFTQ